MEKAIKIPEAADILGITTTHLYKLCALNKVPCFKIGVAVRFLPSQLELFMKGEWTPKAPKRRSGGQVRISPKVFDPDTDPRFQ